MSATIVEGDYGDYLTFYLREYDNLTHTETPFNLSTASTITFKAQKYEEDTVSISGTCSIYDETNGICRYQIPNTANFIQGSYYVEIEIKGVDYIITFGDIHIDVIGDLPKGG